MAKTANTPDYTEEEKAKYLAILCTELATGKEGVNRICEAYRADDKRFPARRTFYKWFESNKELRRDFDSAKYDQAENWFEELVNLFDDLADRTLNKSDVERLRLKFDVVRWMCGKLNPYKFGDNVHIKLAELERKLEKYEAAIDGRK